jgi:hypothetical protein
VGPTNLLLPPPLLVSLAGSSVHISSPPAGHAASRPPGGGGSPRSQQEPAAPSPVVVRAWDGARPWLRTTAPPRPSASSSPAPPCGHRPTSLLASRPLPPARRAGGPACARRRITRVPSAAEADLPAVPRGAARARSTPPPRSSPEVEEDPGHVKGQNTHLCMWVPHVIGVKPLTSNRIHPKWHGCQRTSGA